MKFLYVTTATNGMIHAIVGSSLEAVKYLRALADEGIKCIRWEMKP